MASEAGKVHKFGNSCHSDVIFVVDEQRFYCHKMLLVAKCDYFASMFTSGFKEKDQERIPIDADPAAFKRLMEIIYNGYIEDAKELFLCNSYENLGIINGDYNRKLWSALHDLFALVDRFLLTDIVRHSFENWLIRFDRDCPYNKPTCFHCAVKLLLAVCHKMDEYKKISVSTRNIVKKALSRLSGDICISVEAMEFLLGRE